MPGGHVELEEAAGEYLVYGEFQDAVLSGLQACAVEADGADVAVAVGDFRGFYLEGPAVFQVDLHVREVGGSEDAMLLRYIRFMISRCQYWVFQGLEVQA